jgi:NADH-quinone oxidoreductase subunit J
MVGSAALGTGRKDAAATTKLPMLGHSQFANCFAVSAGPLALADAPVSTPLLHWLLILLLCVVAGVGTVLLLPGKREQALRKVGGALMVISGLVLAGLLFYATFGSPSQSAHYWFWPFAAIAIVGAVRVITHPRPVYSALYFVLTTFASAGLFVLLWAEFMAAALILIYAGAILVTYVFVIMLAQQATTGGDKTAGDVMADYDANSREPVVAAAVGFALMGLLLFVILDKAGPKEIVKSPETGTAAVFMNASESTQSIGQHLFEHHLLNLELAGLLLTIATVGAIIIARRKVVLMDEQGAAIGTEVVLGPATPVDDNPHSIPVYGTDNPRQKAYPET